MKGETACRKGFGFPAGTLRWRLTTNVRGDIDSVFVSLLSLKQVQSVAKSCGAPRAWSRSYLRSRSLARESLPRAAHPCKSLSSPMPRNLEAFLAVRRVLRLTTFLGPHEARGFASDGVTYVPMESLLTTEDLSVEIQAKNRRPPKPTRRENPERLTPFMFLNLVGLRWRGSSASSKQRLTNEEPRATREAFRSLGPGYGSGRPKPK